MAIIFAIAAMVCAIGWLVRWINTAALLWYLIDKGYPEPTKEEWAEYSGKVIWKLIRSSD